MRLLIILTLLIFPSTFIYGDSTNELPQNPTVAAGPAPTITTTGSGMTIHAPGSGILNWQSHNIGSNNYVNYNLNGPYMSRVTGGSPTAIWGQLNVQGGQFFLVNPNGIVFGPNSQINASGLLASSLDIKNQDFMSGKYRFYQNGRSAYVFNQGHITANNGNVVLLSNAVSNTGTITATLGHVALAAGSQVTVGLDDNSGISMAIGAADTSEVYGPDSKKINSAVLNAGSIIADGGKVTLDAQVLNKVFDHALNNTGVIQANTLVNHNGTVELVASGGNVVSSGPIVAHGGTITLDPEDITIQSGGAGSLIDPYDMFIDPVTLSSLDASEVHFQADRNIYINSPVDLNSTFTLEAKNDINVNANITTHGQNITLSADSDFDGMGSLNMAHGTLISSNGGDITLNSGSAMNIAFIDAGSGSVNLSSNSGTILDNGSFVSGGTVNLNAYNGIGPNAPIFTHAGQVNAVSQFNDIHISSNADLEAGQIHAVNGDVYLTADNGSILRSSSLITANNVFLNAFNSIGTETSPLEVD
ncbi:MAG: filamentous hemagglutinin N-terminal domain-containing protein, partial [Candidatus Omnitrophica bacterium]|nr:filamentous hemagglutinin N-terminal domain-containing protein [Candidatus Omnitrophota bacterium]